MTWDTLTFPFCSLVETQCSSENIYDVGFIMDVSDSVGSRDWGVEKTFVKKLARIINISPSGGRVGVVLFNTYAYTQIKFSTYNTYDEFAIDIHFY